MIKSISIQNFRSIKDKITFDLTKPKSKSLLNNYASIENSKVSLTSVIYGANASGKSNIIKAFRALQYLVLNSAKFDPEDSIKPYEPFKLSTLTKDKEVQLQLEFYVNGIRYKYSIAYSQFEITYEQLLFYPKRKEALLFERQLGKEIVFGESFKGEKKSIERLLLPNQLFVSKGALNNSETCLKVFHYFKNHLDIFAVLNQQTENRLQSFNAQILAEAPNSRFSKKLNALICALDTGINSILVKENDISDVKFPDNAPEELIKQVKDELKYDINLLHNLFDENNKKIDEVEFDLSHESTGTKSLLSLSGIILENLENGTTLIVDEFEKNLHPLITTYLIRLYNEPRINTKNAQLIFATHDVTQLNNDNFNRDQVWFTQKDEFGKTELIRCSEITGLRFHTPIDKWYLSGRLGGTAIINDTDFLIEMFED